METNWYALRVVTGKEKKAKQSLESELRIEKLEKYVKNIIIPTEQEIKLKDGKKYFREKMTFPGYLLIECSLVGELPRTIKNTKDIAGFTTDSKNGNPVPLRQNEVDRVLGRIEETHLVDVWLVGEKVIILNGPFSGFNGTISELNPDKIKVKVDVLVFGRPTSIDLLLTELDKSVS